MVYDPAMCKVLESRDVHFFEGIAEPERVTIEVPKVGSMTHVIASMDEGEEEERDGDDEVPKEKEGMDEKDEGDLKAEGEEGTIYSYTPCPHS